MVPILPADSWKTPIYIQDMEKTETFLQRFHIIEHSMCFCKGCEKSLDHILLECDLVKKRKNYPHKEKKRELARDEKYTNIYVP